MMLWKLVLLLSIVFVLTYDPNSKTIERYIEMPKQPRLATPQPSQAIKDTRVLGAIVA